MSELAAWPVHRIPKIHCDHSFLFVRRENCNSENPIIMVPAAIAESTSEWAPCISIHCYYYSFDHLRMKWNMHKNQPTASTHRCGLSAQHIRRLVRAPSEMDLPALSTLAQCSVVMATSFGKRVPGPEAIDTYARWEDLLQLLTFDSCRSNPRNDCYGLLLRAGNDFAIGENRNLISIDLFHH